MSKRNQLTKAEYLPMDIFRGILKRLELEKKYKLELYFTFSVASALRVVDVLSTKWQDILEKDESGNMSLKRRFIKVEQKTGKSRTINFSQSVSDRIEFLYIKLKSPDLNNFIFVNRWGKEPMTKQYINQELKRIRDRYDLPIKNFSSHSFRKTFGRHFYESQGKTSASLILLMHVFNHSSLQMTKVYLGISEDEIAEVYENFEI